MFALFMIVMSVMYPNLGLSCAGADPYPGQLAAMMYLEFFNSAVDLIITICIPKNLAKIKEERIAAGSLLGELDMVDEDIDINELKEKIAQDAGELNSPNASSRRNFEEPLIENRDNVIQIRSP